MKFKSKMDGESVIITTIIYVIFLASIFLVLSSKKASAISTSLIVGLLIVFMIGLITQKVKYYVIDAKSIQIVRVFYKIVIPLNDLNAIKAINYDTLVSSSRRMGIYGVFGYSGTFTNSIYGTMRWYLTNKDQIIYIRLTNGENIFLSPENTDLFYNTALKNVSELTSA